MEQKDKELLLRDLCARVPYHPKGRVVNNQIGATCEEWLTCATFQMFVSVTNNCRLYLRPMSSMTEEEIAEYKCMNDALDENYEVHIDNAYPAFDYLNQHHFDYRNLIEKGLAIEAPEGIYNIDTLK